MKVTGSCHCGSIEFEANVDAEKILICHCNDCQKLSGTSFRTVAMSEVNGLTYIKGRAKEYIKTAESGNRRAQGFCGHCGSSLYATNESPIDRIYGIRIGVLDQRHSLKPSSQIWCNASVKWLNQLNSIPTFDTVPNVELYKPHSKQ
jgi:hypothetical protein